MTSYLILFLLNKEDFDEFFNIFRIESIEYVKINSFYLINLKKK